MTTNKINDIVNNNIFNCNSIQIIIDKYAQLDRMKISIQADEINKEKILNDLYKEYPDLKILIDENKINKIIVEKIKNEDLILNKKTGKVYPLIDNRK